MSEHTFVSHFLEFKSRVARCLGAFFIVWLPLIVFAKPLFERLSSYLLAPIPQASLIATTVTAPFLTPLKLSFFMTGLLVIPYFIYQAWAFVAPGLYPHEKRPIRWLSLISLSLFYLGCGFAYGLVCPLALKFFAMMTPDTVAVMTDIHAYLSFVSTMVISFGLAFQLPVIVCVCLMTGLVEESTLKRKRPLVVVLAFVLGMLLTPPDVISQVMMAIPLLILYELGIVLSRRLKAPQSLLSHDSGP